MLADLIRSQAVVEVFFLLMLLGWLTASAVMMLRSGGRPVEPADQALEARRRATMPPAARAVTGAPRS
jgi:hypothetical protein